MSTSAHIFLHTRIPTGDAAQQLATTLNASIVRDSDGDLSIGRKAAVTDGGEVGGAVTTNPYGAPPNPEPDELSVLDGYDTVFEIRCTTGDSTTQQAEAKQIFAEITERLPWPALLVHNLDTLVAAWHPAVGRTDFPPGTTPDAAHRHLWNQYAINNS